MLHHADSSISSWCLLCLINSFRCVQSSDKIKAAFIYETAYFTLHNFFAQVMRVALTCIIGSVYSSRFLVLLLSAYSLSLWRAETTDFKDTFQDFRLTAHIMNRSIVFVLATWLIFFCISCAQKETVQFLFSDSMSETATQWTNDRVALYGILIDLSCDIFVDCLVFGGCAQFCYFKLELFVSYLNHHSPESYRSTIE